MLNRLVLIETSIREISFLLLHRMFFRHIVNAGFWRNTAKGGEYFLDRYNPGDAKIRFDVVLDRVTGSDPSMTDYVLEQPADYPNCKREILEKTLVEPVRFFVGKDHLSVDCC
jgi:hypothetical protein